MAKKMRTYGVYTKKHPTRKHGIKNDLYFSIRLQILGQRKNCGLGWASEGWTMQKAIHRREELKNYANKTGVFKTHKELLSEQLIKKKKKYEQEKLEKLTVSEYFYTYFKPSLFHKFENSNSQRHCSTFKIWLEPVIGEITFNNINEKHLEEIFYKATKKLAIKTIIFLITTLKKLWEMAEKDGVISSPLPQIPLDIKNKISKHDNARIRFITKTEADLLFKEIRKKSEHLYRQALFSLHCGLRASEVLNLRWQNIDMENGILNLTKTKNNNARSVFISDKVKEILEITDKNHPSGLIFPSKKGTVSKKISVTFKKVADNLFNIGISDRRQRVVFHTLRHTYASWLVMEGVPLYTVQKLLGHKSIKTTMRYAHLSPEYLKKAASVINKITN